jgi:broad specificity phosphatase PhoE/ribonuclease HI
MPRSLVVEADGGSRGNPGPAAYGSVVKDAETGAVLVERAAAIGVATNNVAEYRGVIAGLEEAHRIDPAARIEVRLDSKLVVEQMSGRWKIKHADMRELALRARALHDMSLVSWTWVPRAQNAHADRLLNEVLDGDESAPAPTPSRRPLMRPAMLGDPTTLYLLRHGETPLTVERRFSGRGGSDVGLTDRGRRQAEHAASVLQDRLAAATPAAVVASPLLRTRQTAAVVAERLGVTVQTDDDLAEVAFGEWDGLTFAEARGRDAVRFDAWLGDPRMEPPGGESLVALGERVARARDRLLSRFEAETVLVVAHAMVVKTFVAQALGGPAEAVHSVDVQPATLAELAYWADGRPSLRALGVG